MNWLRELGVRERSAFVAAFGGWALDALDYMVFSFVIPTLISLWGITRGEAGLLATVTLLVSALGGWAAGLAWPLAPPSISRLHAVSAPAGREAMK